MVAINQTGCFLGMQTAARPEGGWLRKHHQHLSVAGLLVHRLPCLRATKGAGRPRARPWNCSARRSSELVHPGIIDTEMLQSFGGNIETIEQRIPLGRVAEATEVAEVVLFLASDEASTARPRVRGRRRHGGLMADLMDRFPAIEDLERRANVDYPLQLGIPRQRHRRRVGDALQSIGAARCRTPSPADGGRDRTDTRTTLFGGMRHRYAAPLGCRD